MRIGILPDLRSSAGGIYQYSLTMLRALQDWAADGCTDEFVILTNNERHEALRGFKEPVWHTKPVQAPSAKGMARELLNRFDLDNFLRRAVEKFSVKPHKINIDAVQSRPQHKHWFRRLGIELMIYPTPHTFSFEVELPYIMAIHDLQHRLQPEFPEVSADGEWERREYVFRNGSRHATLLLADSEVGKEDILNFYGEYGVRPEKVKVLPFLPAAYLPSEVSEPERHRVRKKYALPARYLFYPAQFWPHKNHVRIVRALVILRDGQKITPTIVFCGSTQGKIRRETFTEIMSLARQAGIANQVINLGYVSDADMGPLYSQAACLVMPTFFGPTNIPILEAWAFGCPVITSDIRGVREQAGDAALLADPRSPEMIAEAIREIWTDPGLCEALAQRGRVRLSGYTPAEFRRRLVEIVEEAKAYGTC